jgi:alpha-galactosidase
MAKITFMGAGSTVFVKNIIGDCMLSEVLRDWHFALYDIDGQRLKESKLVAQALNANINAGRAKITAHLGVGNRRAALAGADYVINAIQVGGYQPGTVIDFQIPKKYGLRQTIGDTIGIGGIFRGLRTIPVMLDFARDMEAACPDAWMLNYTNPMAIVTAAMLLGSSVKTVGLCHSVQTCARSLLWRLGVLDQVKDLRWKIAGITHQAWLLEIRDGEEDLYPLIRKLAAEKNRQARKKGAAKHDDMVRMEVLRHFGCYVTESSEHTAEYMPYWINSRHPELIEEFNIPLDEYPRRCVEQIENWKRQRDALLKNAKLGHDRSDEYAAGIMQAMETGPAISIGGNVLNTGLITNLPSKAVVEVPCLVDANGVQGCYVGDLPEQLAAINRTNINVQLLTVEAALKREKEAIYHAAMLDPHTAGELTLDQIRSLCDDLIEAHGDMLPKYR